MDWGIQTRMPIFVVVKVVFRVAHEGIENIVIVDRSGMKNGIFMG